MNKLKETHKKNQFMFLLILTSLILGIGDNIITDKGREALTLLSLGGGGLLGIVGYLVFKKKAINYTVYIIVVGIQSLVLAFIIITPGIFSYMIIYISLFLIAVYQNYKPVIFSGVLSILVSTYGLLNYNEYIFPNYSSVSHIFTFNFLIGLSTLIVVLQCRYSEMLRKEIEKNQKMLLVSREKQELLHEIANAFATAIDYRDPYTGDHSKRVAQLSKKIAEEMDLHQRDVFETYIGALVHDVGKIGIPDYILNKSGPLTNKEYSIIQEHPEIGTRIFDVIKSYNVIKGAIYYHHERWDGRQDIARPSYHGTIKGKDIPLAARIIAVADAYDAMTTQRSYKEAIKIDEAISRINEDSGKHFDIDVVNSFLKVVESMGKDVENKSCS